MYNPMMKSQGRVRSITAYIRDAIKFYDLENPRVAQIMFIIQLGILFGGYWLVRPYTQNFFVVFEQFSVKLLEQEKMASDLALIDFQLYMQLAEAIIPILLIILMIRILSYFAMMFYGTYYHFSLTQPSVKGAERFQLLLRRLPKLIVFNILFYTGLLALAFAVMLITSIISVFMPIVSVLSYILYMGFFAIGIVFMFKDYLIIEFDVGIFNNFKKSWHITKGCRKNVIVNGLWPLCLNMLATLIAIDVENALLALFISSFFEAIVLMIKQRLTVLMFADAASLERHDLARKSEKPRYPLG